MTSMGYRLYRLLLLILPRGFRDEFGREMLQAFADRRQPVIVEAVDVIQLAVRLRTDQLRVDVRHAARSLWHQKTFTVTAIATLALALGPATAVFALFNGVLLDPVPLARDLDRVIAATTANPERNRLGFPWSELNFLDHRDRKVGLAHLGAFVDTSATIGGEVPQQALGAWVSEDMFDVLRVYPARGRKFEAAEMRPGAAPTIILGHEFAALKFPGGDAVGQSMMVDGRATTVIGVLPRGFEFPAGDGQFWQPLIVDRATSNRAQTYLRVMGRLADGATLEDVNRQMNAVADDLARQYPASNAGYRIDVTPAAAQLTRSVRRIVTVLGFAAIAILLLACTNVASLLVVRTAGRRDELSVRTALGASASRLSRQLLIEHLLLALAAAMLAVLVARGLLQLLDVSNLVPAAQVARATVDGATTLFLLGLTIFIAVALGWIVSRRATRAAITLSQRSQSATRELVRLRQALVSIEVGAAVVLLLAAGLLLQSAARLLAIDPGLRTDNVITFQITLPVTGYVDPARRVRFAETLVAELKRLPGVQAAASAAYQPMGSTRATRRFAIDGEPLPQAGTEPLAIDLPASRDYASLMGLRVIQGRWIDERDGADAPPVVVISESFAKQHLPGQQAIGKRLRYFTSRPGQQPPIAEIVGVVSDVRQFSVAEAEAPQMYIPHAQRSWMFASYFVRTAGDPRSVMASLPTAVRAVDRERPIERLRTVDALVQSNTEDRRALSLLIALAAAIALLISAIGVYGVTAATTAARRRELAIRAAIGADPRRLMRLVIRQAMLAAVIGITLGIASGVAASSVLEAVLFEVEPRDPMTYATVGLGLLAVCALATYLPARRAVSGSPAVTLNEPA
jgi:putative ABC transport system permease protein